MGGGINTGKVILGGIVAGIVIDVGEGLANLVVFAEQMAAWVERFGLQEPAGGTIALFNLLGLALGIVLVWTYAAVRPRLGPGPGTAACAGVLVWVLAYLFPMITDCLMGMLAFGDVLGYAIWTLVQTVVAGVAGAYFYKEGGAEQAAA